MNLSEHSILIVEDDQILLRMLANSLKQKGWSVLEARNGAEGIERINETTPDLILLDIDMPEMSGIAMLHNIRDAGKNINVIMLTNHNNPTLIADAVELGISEYLIKADWEIDDIVKKVEEKLPRVHP